MPAMRRLQYRLHRFVHFLQHLIRGPLRAAPDMPDASIRPDERGGHGMIDGLILAGTGEDTEGLSQAGDLLHGAGREAPRFGILCVAAGIVPQDLRRIVLWIEAHTE